MQAFLGQVSSLVWSPYLLTLILGVGLVLTLRIRAISFTKIPYAFSQLIQGTKNQGEGTVAPFSALMMSLSATIGTGNIVGVATAIGIGGPGALFWMWCSALVGMATKYGEAVLAVKYREKNADGKYVGGPMYYIKNGLGENWKWLAVLFAVFGSIAGFGIGNMVQVNSVADSLNGSFQIPDWLTAILLTVLIGLVLLGGVTRIAAVAKVCVPAMAVSYLVFGLLVIIVNITQLPAAISLVVYHAFTATAAEGGFAGATVAMAIQYGVARGVFSNEAGLGSAPIAHAAAATDNPVRQGTIAMLGTFIDTIIVCSITGLAIIMTGVWTTDLQGAALSQAAFDQVLPLGNVIVSLALVVFAFTTIIGWSYYSERCMEYLFGQKIILPFRILWVIAVPIGALVGLKTVWLIADIMNGLMAIPNLIALLLLSGVIATLTKEYYRNN